MLIFRSCKPHATEKAYHLTIDTKQKRAFLNTPYLISSFGTETKEFAEWLLFFRLQKSLVLEDRKSVV